MSDLCLPSFFQRPVYYITSTRLCQEVFQKFFELFLALSRARFICVRRRSLGDLIIISHRLPFVNRFLKSFSRFFCPLSNGVCAMQSLRQLQDYITPACPLSSVFWSFFWSDYYYSFCLIQKSKKPVLTYRFLKLPQLGSNQRHRG